MLVAVVLSAVAMALIPADVWVQTVRDVMAANPQAQPQGMSSGGMASMQRFVSIGAAFVMPWIMLFLLGGILLAIFTMLMGGEATYRQYLAVGAHSFVIGAAGSRRLTAAGRPVRRWPSCSASSR